MKHVKLFEQVDWENDPFGEDSFGSSSEFEIGDRVRIMTNVGGGHLLVGSIGTIIDNTSEADDFWVIGELEERWKNSGAWVYNKNQLRKI